jgi:hypothetical protein
MLNQKGFSYLLIIFSLSILSLLIGSAYYLGTQQTKSQTSSEKYMMNSIQSTSKPIETYSNSLALKEINYLSKFSTNNSGDDRTVFITMNDKSQDLKIADLELTPSSVRTLYSIPLPGAMGFTTPIYSAGTYLVANINGADAGDIMIFDASGKQITSSVYGTNAELDKWIIHYNGEYLGNDVISINLFKIDNSQATAKIDLKTGKVIPNSLVAK